MEKEITKVDKNGEELTKNIFYIVQFIASGRFITSSLWNLVNISEVIHKIKYKFRHDDQKCETCGIKHNSELALFS